MANCLIAVLLLGLMALFVFCRCVFHFVKGLYGRTLLLTQAGLLDK
jgi:hypothetical protein